MAREVKIDTVFVIDASWSMASIIDSVKETMIKFCDNLVEVCGYNGKNITQMRVCVIRYTDYMTDGENAICRTRIFTLPQEREAFEKAVNGINCEKHGVKAPISNGLEALYAAMCSDWVKLTPRVDRGYHNIVLITNNYPLHLMERKDCLGYPEDEFPPDVEVFQNVWDTYEYDSWLSLSWSRKRLVLFVPDGDDGHGHSWSDVWSWDKAMGRAIDPVIGVRDESLYNALLEIVRYSDL